MDIYTCRAWPLSSFSTKTFFFYWLLIGLLFLLDLDYQMATVSRNHFSAIQYRGCRGSHYNLEFAKVFHLQTQQTRAPNGLTIRANSGITQKTCGITRWSNLLL